MSIVNEKTNYTKKFNSSPNSNIKCNWCLYECNTDNIYKLPYIIKNNNIEYYGIFVVLNVQEHLILMN